MEYKRCYEMIGVEDEENVRALRGMLHESSQVSITSGLHSGPWRVTDAEVTVIELAYGKVRVPSHWETRADYLTNSGQIKAHEWYMWCATDLLAYGLLHSEHMGDRQKEAMMWFGEVWSSLHVKVERLCIVDGDIHVYNERPSYAWRVGVPEVEASYDGSRTP